MGIFSHDCEDFIKCPELKKEFTCVQPEPIGYGSTGKVYLIDNDVRKEALKVVDCQTKEMQDETYGEVQRHQRVDDRNVVRIFNTDITIFEVDNIKYCLFRIEYLKNGELLDRLNNPNERIFKDFIKKFKFIKDVALGLKAIHGQGIAHADIKAENIMFDDQNNPKIIDFGSSKFWMGYHNMTGAGIHYMDPALATQISNGKKVGFFNDKTDMYALGVIFYLVEFKRYPYYSKDNRETLQMIIDGNYSIPFTNPFILFLLFHMLHSSEKMRPTDQQLIDWIDYILDYYKTFPEKLEYGQTAPKITNKGRFNPKFWEKLGVTNFDWTKEFEFLPLERTELKKNLEEAKQKKRVLISEGLENSRMENVRIMNGII